VLEVSKAEALISTKVDRASRCTEDFAGLIRLSEEQGCRLIVLRWALTPSWTVWRPPTMTSASLRGTANRSKFARASHALTRGSGIVQPQWTLRSTPSVWSSCSYFGQILVDRSDCYGALPRPRRFVWIRDPERKPPTRADMRVSPLRAESHAEAFAEMA